MQKNLSSKLKDNQFISEYNKNCRQSRFDEEYGLSRSHLDEFEEDKLKKESEKSNPLELRLTMNKKLLFEAFI